jgi:lipopolysaccharide/colanic/teichoic acid biosynthesis glycosyltransferase
MSEFSYTSSTLDLHSGTTSTREFYLHQATPPSGQVVEDRVIHIAAEKICPCVPSPYFAVKSVVDRVFTAVLVLVSLPLMLLIGLAILILDGRPIFYRQTRVGKKGREYRMWKFRTMCRDAESKTGAVWSTAADPRVTALGSWLRCSHLDELPQFFNVLIGDMNLIGPRPERPEFIRDLARHLAGYPERLNARPGITGLAQLRLGYDQSVADVQQKLMLDLEYIRTTSFLADAKIVLSTIPYIASKLVGKWKADPDVDDHINIVAPSEGENEAAPQVQRRDPPSPSELEPHLFATISTGSSPGGVSQPSEL